MAGIAPGTPPGDDEYKSRPGQSEVPVVGDDAPIEDGVDAGTADSDEQLGMV